MKRLHWTTLVGGLLAALAAGVVLGPVAVAVVMLRCCSDSSGPTPGAWLALAAVLVVLVSLAGVLGGLLAGLVRRGIASGRDRGG